MDLGNLLFFKRHIKFSLRGLSNIDNFLLNRNVLNTKSYLNEIYAKSKRNLFKRRVLFRRIFRNLYILYRAMFKSLCSGKSFDFREKVFVGLYKLLNVFYSLFLKYLAHKFKGIRLSLFEKLFINDLFKMFFKRRSLYYIFLKFIRFRLRRVSF